MSTRLVISLAAVAVAAGNPAVAQTTIHLREVCDSRTVFTLAGADLEAGRLLLAMRSEQPPIPGWLVDLDTTVGRARLHIRDPAKGRTGGSVAPGPVLTALPCGTACREIEAWENGRWTPVGPPLSVAERGTLAAGYDNGGRPWAVVVERTGQRGRVRVAASRLEGGVWRPAGRAVAEAIGFPAVHPSPADAAAILVGSLRFSPSAQAGPWLRGMPQDGTGSQVVAITAEAAAWLDDDGALLLTRDRGRTWRRSRRTRQDTVGGWVNELRADLPLHRIDGRFPTLWTPPPAEGTGRTRPALDLTTWSVNRGWRDVARLPEAYPRGVSPQFEAQHILVRGDGHWILVGSCVDTPKGAALELIEVDASGRAEAIRARLDPAWLTKSAN